MIGASLLLPLAILLAFGTTVSFMKMPLLASILLMLPFACCSAVITVALVRSSSHVIYCLDLLGAAIGALVVGSALGHLREEGSLLFLSALTFLLSGCFIIILQASRARTALLLVMVVGTVSFSTAGVMQLRHDWLNIVRTKITERYPQAEVLFSRSSFVGRYDVYRRSPGRRALKTAENGRTIDTMRPNTAEDYQIDPRVPHTLMKDPVILILGLSGDGISKTSKAIGKKVYGVEINPAIVSLQTNELVEFNGHSYEDIDVAVMDGRSYLDQSDKKYDMITLLNAHLARGSTKGRSPSPEYLNTQDAIESYLDHLTERGIINIEEPVSGPNKEPPVWKILTTMRQTLLDRGQTQPEQHFFIFQWRTKRNNYVQILMKKNPFNKEEIANLNKWLHDVDNIKQIEAREGRRMGPIRSTKTTVLHSPDGEFSTNYSRVVSGKVHEDFLLARNLYVTTDNRPFLFDVNPAHPQIKRNYVRILLLTAFLIPFLIIFVVRHRSRVLGTLPYILVVAVTGLGYLLIEVVLIQRFEIFLGSPVVTFATIVGTLLLFSGLGSLWSGRLKQLGVYGSLAGILIFLTLHLSWIPSLFPMAASLPLAVKVALTILSLIPLAFFLGVPFPFVLRIGKEQFEESSAGILFAINAATSALAVPLSVNISTSFGFSATFQVGILVYVVAWILLIAIDKQKLQAMANGFAIVIVSLLLIFPWVFKSAANISENPDRYRVYAVHYGKSSYTEGKILKGGSSSKKLPFAWYFWIIQGQDRTILVDTGFSDSRMAKKWKFRGYVKPLTRLKQLGISPTDVTDVIVTHAHWDHIGNLAAYKKAKIWMQEEEYKYARSKVNPTKERAKGMRWEDVEQLISAEKEGRLHLVQGDNTLTPGITMTLSGGHTPGSQYVTVETLDGPVIIAGDETYLYKNNRRHQPIGNAVDHEANLIAIKQMHRRAASPFFIVPGHDRLVLRKFPTVANGVVQITSVPE